MPYAMIEKMYSSLTSDKQEEVYDFICYLFSKQEETQQASMPEKTYSQSLDEFRAAYKELLNDPDESEGIDEAFENLRNHDESLRGTQEDVW